MTLRTEVSDQIRDHLHKIHGLRLRQYECDYKIKELNAALLKCNEQIIQEGRSINNLMRPNNSTNVVCKIRYTDIDYVYHVTAMRDGDSACVQQCEIL